MADITNVAEDYDGWGKEEREEYGVQGDAMETRIGRACRKMIIDACKNAELANHFPARAVAIACLYAVLGERRLLIRGSVQDWVFSTTSQKVDIEDFDEAVAALKSSTKGKQEVLQ